MKNFETLKQTFLEIRNAYDKLLFSATTFDEAREILAAKRKMQDELIEKFRLANDLQTIDSIQINDQRTNTL